MEKIKLKDVLEVRRGTNLSGKYYSIKGSKIRLTLGNFAYPLGGFKHNTSKKNIYYNGPMNKKFILSKGDIITPLSEQVPGLLGETAIIPQSDLYIQSGDIGLIIPNEKKLFHKYAYYLISSSLIKKQLSISSQQTKIRHTSPDLIKNCTAWIPTIKHQQHIVDIIGSIDEYIENLNKQLKIMNNLTKLVFQFMFYNKKNVINNMKKFNFVENPFASKIGNNVKNFNKSKKYVATANVEKQTIESVDSFINFNNRPSRANNQPKLNTIWFAKMKKTNKKILVNENDVDICENYIFSTGFQGLQIEKKYLYYYWEYINLDCFEEYKNKNANGATQQAIDETTLKLFTIKLPNFEKIDKFNRIVNPIFEKKSQIRKLIETSKSYKSIILPLLINFQIF